MSFDVRTRIASLKSSAKHRGINVNLDIARYQTVIDSGCYFCGDDLKNEKGYCLDRVDNTKGYTLKNVVGCCKLCNRAKSNMDVFEFMTWAERLGKRIKEMKDAHASLEKMGMTIEMYDEICEKIMLEKTNGLPKERLKMVNK